MWLNGKTNYISAVEIRGPEKSILDESDWTKTRSECLGSTVQLNYWVDFWYLWVEKWRWVHWTDVWNWHCFGKSWWWNDEERWYNNITSQCSTKIFPIQIMYMTVSWTEENSGKENIERIGEKCSEQYNASALSTSYRSL